MRMFVTGATGFIGSHFLNCALAAGHDLIALRRGAQSEPRIPLAMEPDWLAKSLLEVDADDLADVDCVVHLAATGVSPRTASWEELLLWNVSAPLQLLARSCEAGVAAWVIAGSFAEYGAAAERYRLIPPDAPLEPTYPYAASKAAGSVLFRALAVERQASLSYLRLFSVYGEGQHESNLWPTLRRAALADEDLALSPGEQVRDFVAVEHVADRLLSACTNAAPRGAPRMWNVASGRPQTVRQFAEHWWRRWKATGKLRFGALPYRPGEIMRYVPLVQETPP